MNVVKNAITKYCRVGHLLVPNCKLANGTCCQTARQAVTAPCRHATTVRGPVAFVKATAFACPGPGMGTEDGIQ